MAIVINDKSSCTGCGACWNICPKDCIKSENDEEGFPYPVVDSSICINCGLCEKVCPIVNFHEKSSTDAEVYAAWSKDSDVRYNSTSGGVFSELSYSIIKNDGYVVGAAYDDENLVHHIMVFDSEGIKEIRQSKYLQSNIEFVYRLTCEKLDAGEVVLFCGAPCQIAGLKSFLRKDYPHLYTVDFICRGMNSPKAYRFWLKELEEKFGAKTSKVWFKYKEDGWKKSPLCTRVDFFNGKSFVAKQESNTFMLGYLRGNLYLRPSCSNCRFKGEARNSDITVADFWKIEAELDDDYGTSMVMVNTQKGKELFNSTKNNLEFYVRNMNEIRTGNVCFDDSVTLNPKSKEFLKALGSRKFSELVAEYTKIPTYRRVVNKVKNMIKQIVK